jgi:anti-sigma factor RsiW
MMRMDCSEVRELLNAYVDDELSVSEQRAVSHHIAGCSVCTATLGALKSLGASIRAAGTFTPPVGFEAHVTRGLETATPTPRAPRPKFVLAASHLAAAVLGALVLYGAMTDIGSSGRIVHDTIAVHTQAMMSNRLIQVASNDTHSVRPWLTERLPFAPPIKNIAPVAFPLLGGRVERLQGRPAAVAVYGRRKHHITLFIQPIDATSIPTTLDATRNGFALAAWRAGDFAFLALSDLGPDELKSFLDLLR